ncbi:MAG TPA: helix-turn-helix domain-containing protein, partial [Prevotella sp.]
GFLLSYKFFNEIIKGIHELSSLFLFSRNHPVCTLYPEEAEKLMAYFSMIKERVNDVNHHFRKETVQSLMTTMIYDISNAIYRVQNIRDKKQTRAEAIFTDFIKLVEQNFRKERRVGWYGFQLGITPKYLSETIKQISRRTPNEWIDNYVTLEIRVQLKNSTKSIKEIAQDLNFPNQSFLGKYFKEHVGMSPSEYRRS